MMRRMVAVSFIIAVLLGAFITAAAQSTPRDYRIHFQQFKLKNGLRIILAEDHSAPTVSVAVTYDVGSRNEHRGRTGFAHLFEHMMFQGSENVGKGEHMMLVEENGGTMNGTTNADRTNYFETLPANQLDLALFLESDRMRSLAINQANLDNQRNAVQEERRLRIDNQPYGRTFELLQETAYDNFANQHSTIGSMQDLNAATLKDVQSFFDIYYAPNNAVLSIVGDFETKEALASIRKYFESIPSQPPPAAPNVHEPSQKEERRKTIEDPFARVPRISIAFKVPPSNTPDWYAASVLAYVVGAGPSSRLYRRLVEDEEIVLGIQAGVPLKRGPALATISLTPRPGKDLAQIERAVYDEIARLQKYPPTADELMKVRMALRRMHANTLLSSQNRAVALGVLSVYFKDPDLINTQQEAYSRVTAADVQRVAKKYFIARNRTVVTTMPKTTAVKEVAAGGVR